MDNESRVTAMRIIFDLVLCVVFLSLCIYEAWIHSLFFAIVFGIMAVLKGMEPIVGIAKELADEVL